MQVSVDNNLQETVLEVAEAEHSKCGLKNSIGRAKERVSQVKRSAIRQLQAFRCLLLKICSVLD